MAKDERKGILLRSIGALRRHWSYDKNRIAFILITVLIAFTLIYNHNIPHSFLSSSMTFKQNEKRSNKTIACLIPADATISPENNKNSHDRYVATYLHVLELYDKYLSNYCDIKVFIVNTSIEITRYHYKSLLPNSQVIWLPNNDKTFWKRRRHITQQILQWSHAHLLEKSQYEYDWFLKFASTDALVFVDHFEKLVYDGFNSKFDMDKPLILGHYLEHGCANFVYALSVYAMNSAFLARIGDVLIEKNEGTNYNDLHADCESLQCTRHTEDDFDGICLEDAGIEIHPFARDEQGRPYFLIFQFKDHYRKMDKWIDDWYWRGKGKRVVTDNCCAKYPVAFGNYKGESNFLTLKRYYDQFYSVNNSLERDLSLISDI